MTRLEDRFPLGAQLTQTQQARDPYPLFARMLAEEPVSWVPAFNLWMVTRRDDVIEILRDADTFTMEPEGGQINPMEDTFGPMMLSIDGPDHKRIRDVFVEPYRPRHVKSFYTDLISRVSEQLLDEMAQQELVDLDRDFSDRLAIYTVVATLGFAIDDIDQFRGWYDEFALAIGNTAHDEEIRRRGKQAFAEFHQLVLAQITKLQAAPNNSVLSQIVHNEATRLTVDQIVSNVALTFFGGVETTSAMLSNTLWALLSHPEQLAQVRLRPGLLAAAIEESLRWEAPVQSAMRFPVRDVALHGVRIGRGEKIYGMLGAANRDPAFYPDPDRFDIHRPNSDKHLSFAYGPHFCFGAPLARLEGQLGLGLLLQRFPNLRLHPDQPTAPYGHEFRSTPNLYVT